MDFQPGASPPSTTASPVPSASEPIVCAPWPRSVQFALGILLGDAGIFFLAGKSLYQALQAGSSTIPSRQIDLNSATQVELMLLPGV